MENIGRRIVDHCKGLPLAIVVLGGLLAQKETVTDWEKVVQDIDIHVTGGEGGGGVMEVLAFSYWDLPYYLKPCFLYLGQYPEDKDINVESLVRKWVAEGIVSPKQYGGVRGKTTLVDVGRNYVQELAGRCMVQLKLTRYSQRTKSCRLHDLVREFCLSKLDEQEDFLKVIHLSPVNGNNSSSAPSFVSSTSNVAMKARRLAVFTDVSESSEVFGEHRNIKSCVGYNTRLRSVSYFNVKNLRGKVEYLIEGLNLLRVLDLEGMSLNEMKKLPEEVGKLLHLRYLSLRRTNFNELPSSIGNLRCLETLDLRIRLSLIVPDVLWKMEQLKHLYLPKFLNIFEEPKLLHLDTLKNLETLVNFNPSRCDAKCMLKFGNLQKLSVHKCCSVEDAKAILDSPSILNGDLRYFAIDVRLERDAEESIGVVSQLFASAARLHKLAFQGHLRNLPKFQDMSHNLTVLELNGTSLKEDPMPTLEKLPRLGCLRLYNNSFIGKSMICFAPQMQQPLESSSRNMANYPTGGFPHLKSLTLWWLPNLEDLKVEKGAMPNLQHLDIGNCHKLKQMPEGLQYITSLMKMRITAMPSAFDDRIKEGGEDFYKVQRIPEVVIARKEAFDKSIRVLFNRRKPVFRWRGFELQA